jgi:hypothetical protein
VVWDSRRRRRLGVLQVWHSAMAGAAAVGTTTVLSPGFAICFTVPMQKKIIMLKNATFTELSYDEVDSNGVRVSGTSGWC